MDTQSAYEVVLNAVMDGKAAIRYFRKDVVENGNSYGIDSNQIWGGGNSAGGVLFLHAAHVGSTDEFILPLDENIFLLLIILFSLLVALRVVAVMQDILRSLRE